MTKSAVDDEFVAMAIAYAKQRWLLDDPAVVREYCEDRYHPLDTPESLIDDMALRYDFLDPRQSEWGAFRS